MSREVLLTPDRTPAGGPLLFLGGVLNAGLSKSIRRTVGGLITRSSSGADRNG